METINNLNEQNMNEMEKQNVEVKEPVETPVKKVGRRGIATSVGTTRLKFSHEQARPNGLFIGHLDSVVTTMIKIGEDRAGMPSFNGLEIPKITFTFASNEPEVAKRHYVTLAFNAVESNVNTIPGGKEEWKVNSVFDWIKHILNVYMLKGRELTNDEAAALSLSYDDFDEQGEYVSVEPEDVIKSWRTLFENVENMLNRGLDGKPYYKTKDGKDIPVWMKLIRFVKSGRKGWTAVNNGNLAFPGFVGEGCIEVYQNNVIPSIHVDIIKETILPMKIEKPKEPNFSMNTVGGMPNMNTPVIDTATATDQAFGQSFGAEAMEDMPF